jgi:hypothetical protein
MGNSCCQSENKNKLDFDDRNNKFTKKNFFLQTNYNENFISMNDLKSDQVSYFN